MEENLIALLKTLCPRVFFDVAPEGTATPYVTLHHIGGKSLRALDGDHCGERNSFMQINVWAPSRLSSMTLARSIEDALVASSYFQSVRPDGEPIADHDPDTNLFGTIQRFSIWATR
jgi:hypothetical protein